MQRAEAVGTVSKYLILSERTSSSLCSMVTLKRSPSSDCRRKKKSPWEKKENDSACAEKATERKQAAHLHLVHDGRNDDDSSRVVGERMPPFGDGDSVLRSVHVAVDDVVLAADKHPRRTLEPIC